jgi:prevent-host-death family protein
MTMKTVSARQANHEFSDLLSRVERGEEILITKRNKPVAVLSPYRPPLMTPEREKAVQHAIDVMVQGLPWAAPCEGLGVKKCTSGDDQLRYQHPRLRNRFGTRREGAAGARSHRPCNASRMDYLTASNPCGVRQCGDPKGGNTNRGHPKDDRCLACCTPNTSGRRRRSCGRA